MLLVYTILLINRAFRCVIIWSLHNKLIIPFPSLRLLVIKEVMSFYESISFTFRMLCYLTKIVYTILYDELLGVMKIMPNLVFCILVVRVMRNVCVISKCKVHHISYFLRKSINYLIIYPNNNLLRSFLYQLLIYITWKARSLICFSVVTKPY